MTDELDKIFSKLSFGYEYQMSDYAGSKEQEDEYEKQGLEEIATTKQAIQALIDRECYKARVQSAVDISKRLEYELAKRALSSPPPKGARFMTDQEFIATITMSYIDELSNRDTK
jgi:hypothetical protein